MTILRRLFFLTAMLVSLAVSARAQHILHGDELNDYERVKRAKLVRGHIEAPDTVLTVDHFAITIYPQYVFKSKKQQEKYDRLVYNVKKVWPYAKLIQRVYKELTDSISKIPTEEGQKAFVKEQEKKLRAEFEDELVRLSITQGRILIKLVDRQTGSTTYQVLKDLKGGFSAFIFQGVARLFGSNLKSEYDALEEDKMIEHIISRIENGTI